jgi:endo-1,4-beta-xylanase
MRVLNLLPAVALLPSALGQLHKLTKAKGKYFGSATDNYELKDAPYFAILTDVDEFGQITPSNAQKWAYSEPTPGNFSFAGGDEVADLAEATGQMLRCHALVWHSQVADYSMFDKYFGG